MSEHNLKQEILDHTHLLKDHLSNNEYAMYLIKRIEDLVSKLDHSTVKSHPSIGRQLPPHGI